MSATSISAAGASPVLAGRAGRVLMAWCAGLALLMGTVAHADADAGKLDGVSVDVNGTGLESNGRPVRLIGVHFPSDSLLCGSTGQGCLEQAMVRLQEQIDSGVAVVCEVVGVSAAGTHMSSCRLGQEDLGGWLVENGLALADRHVSRRYVRSEREAREAGRGLWAEVSIGTREG